MRINKDDSTQFLEFFKKVLNLHRQFLASKQTNKQTNKKKKKETSVIMRKLGNDPRIICHLSHICNPQFYTAFYFVVICSVFGVAAANELGPCVLNIEFVLL